MTKRIITKLISKGLFVCLLFLFESCSPSKIKIADEYYIYSPDEYHATSYLKCKLASENDPEIDSLCVVYWNDSTVIIGRGECGRDWWIISASDSTLKCCNNDTIKKHLPEYYIQRIIQKHQFHKLVLK